MKLLTKSIVVVVTMCTPLLLSAADRAMQMQIPTVRTMDTSRAMRATVNVVCPSGWSKVFDIANSKNKWGENRPVVTCKPNSGQVMNCPKGTFFYVKGNESLNGYNNGEIGCHTPVQ